MIQESRSPLNSSISCSQNDGTFRLVSDQQHVNAVTMDENYPLPVLSDLLISLSRETSVLLSPDLLSDCRQVELKPASWENMTSSTSSFHYELLRMPFCLKSASFTFQMMINNLFCFHYQNFFFLNFHGTHCSGFRFLQDFFRH